MNNKNVFIHIVDKESCVKRSLDSADINGFIIRVSKLEVIFQQTFKQNRFMITQTRFMIYNN